MVMFLFLVIALAVVVAAVTLAVVGGGESDGPLPEAAPERLQDPLPLDRPVDRADVESLRFPLAARGYRMADVDDALGRLGAELAERDARIADLESALAGAQAAAHGPCDLGHGQRAGTPGGPAVSDGTALAGPDGALRCPWALSTEDYVAYHDEEWGRPVHGDDALFERLSLEAFQSGLSWITILRRRDGFRAAFADFKIAKVAAFTDERPRAPPRRRRASSATAPRSTRPSPTRACWPSGRPGELDELIWSHAPDPGDRPAPKTLSDVPAVTPESTALSKALKKRGLRFVGPTTAYALMQACGLVDDHLETCVARSAPRGAGLSRSRLRRGCATGPDDPRRHGAADRQLTAPDTSASPCSTNACTAIAWSSDAPARSAARPPSPGSRPGSATARRPPTP